MLVITTIAHFTEEETKLQQQIRLEAWNCLPHQTARAWQHLNLNQASDAMPDGGPGILNSLQFLLSASASVPTPPTPARVDPRYLDRRQQESEIRVSQISVTVTRYRS